jgi:hypothetical protein
MIRQSGVVVRSYTRVEITLDVVADNAKIFFGKGCVARPTVTPIARSVLDCGNEVFRGSIGKYTRANQRSIHVDGGNCASIITADLELYAHENDIAVTPQARRFVGVERWQIVSVLVAFEICSQLVRKNQCG